MGKVKSLRRDIIRPDELKVYLLMAKHKPPHHTGLMAMLYGFGKRVSEVITMERDDIGLGQTGIICRFKILKTKDKSGVQPFARKRLAYSHWLAPYLQEYIEARDRRYGGYKFLFPGRGKSGHLTREGAWYILKQYSPDLWPHLIRHSLAVQLAENGATLPQLVAFFDWVDDSTALTYIRTYGQAMDELADKLADRPF